MRLAYVTVEEATHATVAHVEGEIDLSNADDVQRALFEALARAAGGLVVDLAGIAYLDSAGVRLLFELARRASLDATEVRLCVPPDSSVRRVLDVASVATALAVDDSVEASLLAFEPAP